MKTSPVRKTKDLTSLRAGPQRTVAITTPASRMTTAAATTGHVRLECHRVERDEQRHVGQARGP